MSAWMPIDSAPKDGTKILACEEDEIGVVWWDGEQWRDYGDLGACGMQPYEPTDWMPLPSPPQSEPPQ